MSWVVDTALDIDLGYVTVAELFDAIREEREKAMNLFGKQLKTLGEFNRDRAEEYTTGLELPRRNGIECPNCDAELWDSEPLVTLTSDPPEKKVHCRECHWRGYRIA